MKVRDLMIREVQTCRPEDSLKRAAQLMWDHDCGCVPVIDDGSRVVGMLTDRDICMAAYTRGEPLGALEVRGAMSTKVQSCAPSDDVTVSEARMRDEQIRRLPVTNADRLIGIISLNDLAVAAGHKTKGVDLNKVGKTLAAICEHRAPGTTRAA